MKELALFSGDSVGFGTLKVYGFRVPKLECSKKTHRLETLFTLPLI